MAKEGGEAAGWPAGAGLIRVTHHDKIISCWALTLLLLLLLLLLQDN